jgi:hypothetical protein
MKSNTWLWIVIVVVIVLLGWWYYSSSSGSQNGSAAGVDSQTDAVQTGSQDLGSDQAQIDASLNQNDESDI